MEFKILKVNVRDRGISAYEHRKLETKSRMYFNLVSQPQDNKFVPCLWNDMDFLRKQYRKIVPDILEIGGFNKGEYKANWSKNCGCNCGCSPGFRLTRDPKVDVTESTVLERGAGRMKNRFGISVDVPWYKMKRYDIYVTLTADFVEEDNLWCEVIQGRTYRWGSMDGPHYWGIKGRQTDYDVVREFKAKTLGGAPSATKNPDTSTRDKIAVGSLLL
jgi:hypothetical protein